MTDIHNTRDTKVWSLAHLIVAIPCKDHPRLHAMIVGYQLLNPTYTITRNDVLWMAKVVDQRCEDELKAKQQSQSQPKRHFWEPPPPSPPLPPVGVGPVIDITPSPVVGLIEDQNKYQDKDQD